MPPRQKRKAAEAAEVKAKRAKGETDLDNDLKWGQAGEVLSKGVYPMIYLSSDTLKGCTKAAGFDIDFTVIETKSGRKFATGMCCYKLIDLPVIVTTHIIQVLCTL